MKVQGSLAVTAGVGSLLLFGACSNADSSSDPSAQADTAWGLPSECATDASPGDPLLNGQVNVVNNTGAPLKQDYHTNGDDTFLFHSPNEGIWTGATYTTSYCYELSEADLYGNGGDEAYVTGDNSVGFQLVNPNGEAYNVKYTLIAGGTNSDLGSGGGVCAEPGGIKFEWRVGDGDWQPADTPSKDQCGLPPLKGSMILGAATDWQMPTATITLQPYVIREHHGPAEQPGYVFRLRPREGFTVSSESMRLEGWNDVPDGYGATFEWGRAPAWLKLLGRVPRVDRFAYPSMAKRGLGVRSQLGPPQTSPSQPCMRHNPPRSRTFDEGPTIVRLFDRTGVHQSRGDPVGLASHT